MNKSGVEVEDRVALDVTMWAAVDTSGNVYKGQVDYGLSTDEEKIDELIDDVRGFVPPHNIILRKMKVCLTRRK